MRRGDIAGPPMRGKGDINGFAGGQDSGFTP